VILQGGLGRVMGIVNRMPLVVVVVAVVIGVSARAALRPHVDAALPWLLAALVATVGAATELPHVGQGLETLVVGARGVLAAGIAMPGVAWASSRLVSGPARLGVLALGFAPAEIASTATVSVAGGDAIAAAIALGGSVLVTAAVVGPGLGLLSGRSISGMALALSLGRQVLAPFGVGLVAGPLVRRRASRDALDGLAVVMVGALAALVASELAFGADLAIVVLSAALVVGGGYLIGAVAGIGLGRNGWLAVVLTCGMRDFAIAAAIANSAFGPAAIAPAAPFGVIVLVSGTAVAAVARRRQAHASPPT